MQQQNGTHIELKPGVIGNIMGKIPPRLGLVALIVFGLVFIALAYFGTGFRMKDVMEVPLRVQQSQDAGSYVTASVSKNRAKKLQKGDKVTLQLPGHRVSGVIAGITAGLEESYINITLEQRDDKAAQYLRQAENVVVNGRIEMGEYSVWEFFVR